MSNDRDDFERAPELVWKMDANALADAVSSGSSTAEAVAVNRLRACGRRSRTSDEFVDLYRALYPIAPELVKRVLYELDVPVHAGVRLTHPRLGFGSVRAVLADGRLVADFEERPGSPQIIWPFLLAISAA